MIALVGMLVLVGLAAAVSEQRRNINLRVVAMAFVLQALFATLVLAVPFGQAALSGAAAGVQSIVDYAMAGSSFLFGPLVSDSETYVVWPITTAADGTVQQPLSQGRTAFILAFRVLPPIIFISSLVAVLYHLRIMQLVVMTIGGALRKVIGVSPVESLCAAANIFVGMVESPLVIRPYLAGLSRAQLFTIMGVGLSTSAGATLIAYAAVLGEGSAEPLIAAAFMAAPGGLLMAKILVPDDPGAPDSIATTSLTRLDMEGQERAASVVEAAADGAMAGLRIAVAVGAMLLAFTALLSMLNGIVGGITGLIGIEGITLDTVLGWVFAPIAFLIGVPWEEAPIVGNLLGQKIILNEIIAFANLSSLDPALSPQSRTIAIFALCGFANLASLAIVLGGLGTLIPERKSEISRLGIKAVLCGVLANLMSAAIASFLLALL